MRVQNNITLNLNSLLRDLEAAAKAGADVVAEASLRVTPDDPSTGGTDLRRSQRVTSARSGATARAAVSYGTRQAVPQHQRMDYRHRPGQQAKYLEQPLHGSGPLVLAAAAAEMRRRLGG